MNEDDVFPEPGIKDGNLVDDLHLARQIDEDALIVPPSARVHRIDYLALRTMWDVRHELVENYFDILRQDADALYDVPVAGDILFGQDNNEIWVYRVEVDVPIIEGQKYDGPTENGEVVAFGDVTSFDFKLVRGGEQEDFVARLIEYRPGFWAKLTGFDDTGYYTFEEIERTSSGMWSSFAGCVNDYAYEQTDLQDLPIGLRVYVTKNFKSDGSGWNYVFGAHHEQGNGDRQQLVASDPDSTSAETNTWDIEEQDGTWGVEFEFVSRVVDDNGTFHIFKRTAEFDATGHLHSISAENAEEGSSSSSVSSSVSSSPSSSVSSSPSSASGFTIATIDTEANILALTPAHGTIALGTDTDNYYVYDSSLGWATFSPS